VEGEPLEIYPFLGSSRLEEPINRFASTVVFHGHAHRGHPDGATASAVPVYNVALPLLQQLFPEQPPFRVVEVPVAAARAVGAAGGAGGAGSPRARRAGRPPRRGPPRPRPAPRASRGAP